MLLVYLYTLVYSCSVHCTVLQYSYSIFLVIRIVQVQLWYWDCKISMAPQHHCQKKLEKLWPRVTIIEKTGYTRVCSILAKWQCLDCIVCSAALHCGGPTFSSKVCRARVDVKWGAIALRGESSSGLFGAAWEGCKAVPWMLLDPSAVDWGTSVPDGLPNNANGLWIKASPERCIFRVLLNASNSASFAFTTRNDLDVLHFSCPLISYHKVCDSKSVVWKLSEIN